jgi:hypothetical protein
MEVVPLMKILRVAPQSVQRWENDHGEISAEENPLRGNEKAIQRKPQARSPASVERKRARSPYSLTSLQQGLQSGQRIQLMGLIQRELPSALTPKEPDSPPALIRKEQQL